MSLPDGSRTAARGREAPFHPVVRAIWAARLGGEAEADRFLAADADLIPASDELPGLGDAVDRMELALATGERIAVFGHDDPDGIGSAVLVVEALEVLGADVSVYIPDREVEGHGLYPELIDRFLAEGASLLVTTDGCSSNRAETDLAASLGLDVIVTDHHEVAAGRATPVRLVNPKADAATSAARGDLTGAGVAALVVRELLDRMARPDVFLPLLDLVALGTIADWGDLGRSNRTMVARGLEDVSDGRRPAIAVARDTLGLDAGDVLRPEAMRSLAAVFASVPSRAGRSLGAEALLGRPGVEAAVDTLVARWRADEAALTEAVVRVEERAREEGVLDGTPAVLVLTDAPPRALGRAATRLVDLTGRPAAVLLARGDSVVAELRGPEGVHLVDVLAGMRELLASWGGHRVAAGFSADASRLEMLRARLADALALETPAPAPPPVPEATIDAAALDGELARSIRAAAPFGKGNPAPVLRVRDFDCGAGDALLVLEPAGEHAIVPRVVGRAEDPA